jgi:hypothetical protein
MSAPAPAPEMENAYGEALGNVRLLVLGGQRSLADNLLMRSPHVVHIHGWDQPTGDVPASLEASTILADRERNVRLTVMPAFDPRDNDVSLPLWHFDFHLCSFHITACSHKEGYPECIEDPACLISGVAPPAPPSQGARTGLSGHACLAPHASRDGGCGSCFRTYVVHLVGHWLANADWRHVLS